MSEACAICFEPGCIAPPVDAIPWGEGGSSSKTSPDVVAQIAEQDAWARRAREWRRQEREKAKGKVLRFQERERR